MRSLDAWKNGESQVDESRLFLWVSKQSKTAGTTAFCWSTGKRVWFPRFLVHCFKTVMVMPVMPTSLNVPRKKNKCWWGGAPRKERLGTAMFRPWYFYYRDVKILQLGMEQWQTNRQATYKSCTSVLRTWYFPSYPIYSNRFPITKITQSINRTAPLGPGAFPGPFGPLPWRRGCKRWCPCSLKRVIPP